ncbi:DUF3556 domain-containing protein [Gordonia sp. PDNC005]|uniref:DUF3556 domain-containing protein n=1 Tax=unclassified Gordonia (in: high G+C Gram-positive bacteria) TaxID=2657482 RepID=UPI0019664110|nr:DUF3556 domain-containing protein [Gordonia sp. PDNC005]QRY64430.1 DUF3556 domain-containing protein [Gordonia sp. PDNC005]
MGLLKPNFPPVDPETFLDRPFMDRLQVLGAHWAEYGFGTPKIINIIYLVKVAVLHIALGVTIATTTSGLGVFDITTWWNQPIVYQKLVLWTMLLEILGLGGSWGPLAGHFKPMTGGFHFWLKPNTLRMAPWPDKVPFTGGDRRTLFDVALYAAILMNVVVALVLPSVDNTTLEALRPGSAGLVNPAALYSLIAMVVAMGLRDKVVFLGGRSEQYLPAVVFFAVMPFIDMIIALKLLIVIVWVGAGVSKLGHHFSMVIPPMLSNTPWLPFKGIKRAHYRRFPDDMRPSVLAGGVGHVLGTVVEIITPLVLLFSTNRTLTLCAVVLMVAFHLFIFSTFPLAVPLEWNILFAYAAVFLFWGFPAWDGFGVTDATAPWAIVLAVAVMLFFPILGNLRPDLVSFLPSMRQYAGNWASATWALAPGAEEKLEEFVVRGAQNTRTQLLGSYPPDVADVVMHQLMGWRSLHSQGRALFSLMQRELGDDINTYTLREAEFACNSILGFNFGDGHFHNKHLIDALQRRCNFAPGEFIVAWIESQPIHKGTQEYQIIDAALGVVERGTYRVNDAINTQPWLPDGPIPFDVHSRADVAPLAGTRFAQATASAGTATASPAAGEMVDR